MAFEYGPDNAASISETRNSANSSGVLKASVANDKFEYVKRFRAALGGFSWCAMFTHAVK